MKISTNIYIFDKCVINQYKISGLRPLILFIYLFIF